jgi:hypothetical protein
MNRYFAIGLAMLVSAALGAAVVPMRQWLHICEIEV